MDNNVDSMGIGKALEMFPDQVKKTFNEALNSNIEKLDFDSIVVSGMGGSSNAGKIIQSWQETVNLIPITVYNAYGLPAWVNKKTLVILNSYSGNTEETLSAYQYAKDKNSQVIGLTTGGEIGKMINNNEIKGAIISAGDTNPSGFPKSGLGLSLGGLLGVLVKCGYIDLTEQELNTSLGELVNIREKWDVKTIAEWLNDYIPVYFGSREFIGPLNAAKNATCEIGRVYTQFYDFPEVNHVLVEAMQIPQEVKNNRYLFFESNFDNERIKLRYEVTKQILDEMNLSYSNIKLSGSNFFVQSLELAHYGAWIGYFLSLLRNEDPGPEPWIIKLKSLLSQPVH